MKYLFFILLLNIQILTAQTIIKRMDNYVLIDTCLTTYQKGDLLQVANKFKRKTGEIKVIKCKDNEMACVIQKESSQYPIIVGDHILLETSIKPDPNTKTHNDAESDYARLYRIGEGGLSFFYEFGFVKGNHIDNAGLEFSLAGRVDLRIATTTNAKNNFKSDLYYGSILLKHDNTFGLYLNISYSKQRWSSYYWDSQVNNEIYGIGFSLYNRIQAGNILEFIPEVSITENIASYGAIWSTTISLSTILFYTKDIALVIGGGVGFAEKEFPVTAIQCGISLL